MKKILLAAVLLAATPAFADSNTGTYVTGAFGMDSIGIDQGGIDSQLAPALPGLSSSTNEDATGWKLGLGYQFNDYFALEGTYVSLGTGKYRAASSSGSYSVDFKPSGWDMSMVGLMPVTDTVDVFGKVGLVRARMEEDASTGSVSTSNWRPSFGAGVRYKFNDNVAVRTEVEQFHEMGDNATTGEMNVNLWSLGMDYRF